jgi:hypothetical protein
MTLEAGAQLTLIDDSDLPAAPGGPSHPIPPSPKEHGKPQTPGCWTSLMGCSTLFSGPSIKPEKTAEQRPDLVFHI